MLRSLLSLEGRIGREKYVTYGLAILVGKLALLVLIMLVGGRLAAPLEPSGDYPSGRWTFLVILAVLDSLALWPFIVLNVRRMHDLGVNGRVVGWTVVAATVLGLIGLLPPPEALPDWIKGFPPILGFMVMGEYLLGLSVTPGMSGPNAYGPEPRRFGAAPA